MFTYTFPLRPIKSIMPVSLVTDFPIENRADFVNANDCLLVFPDGKSCHIRIICVFDVEPDCKGLHSLLTMDGYGNTIVSNGENRYQVAYKQTSEKS